MGIIGKAFFKYFHMEMMASHTIAFFDSDTIWASLESIF